MVPEDRARFGELRALLHGVREAPEVSFEATLRGMLDSFTIEARQVARDYAAGVLRSMVNRPAEEVEEESWMPANLDSASYFGQQGVMELGGMEEPSLEDEDLREEYYYYREECEHEGEEPMSFVDFARDYLDLHMDPLDQVDEEGFWLANTLRGQEACREVSQLCDLPFAEVQVECDEEGAPMSVAVLFNETLGWSEELVVWFVDEDEYAPLRF